MVTDFNEQIFKIKYLIKEKLFSEALFHLTMLADPMDDLPKQNRYIKTFSEIPLNELNLQKIKIGVVGTSSIEHLVDILKFWLALDGFNADIYQSEFNTMEQSILDNKSNLYKFKPDVIWIFSSYRDVMKTEIPWGCTEEVINEQIMSEVNHFTDLWEAIKQHSTSYILQNNADLPLDRIFGNYEGSVVWGRINALRQFNLRIAIETEKRSGVSIFDLDYLSSVYGKRLWFDERYWYYSKHAFTLNAFGFIAFKMSRFVKGIKGKAKKCVVLDLDNTLWGGVIGDDGINGIVLGNQTVGEAFVDFQKYLKNLKDRGIILSVCSKNQEENAKKPFESHPDMYLKLKDITVFVANWNNKVDNIKYIAESLDIGLDSMVFVDDNPAERGLVKHQLPMVAVPDIPEDPSRYIRIIDQCCYFETILFTNEDSKRTDMYISNLNRKKMKKNCTDITEFLKGLKMKAFVGELDEINLPRISQLINKSNQFHLTTTRYNENQIKAMNEDKNIILRYFKLKDRYGDNGLISVIIMKRIEESTLFVDTWVMSCRVLARGMEQFIQGEMMEICAQLDVKYIIGKYIPTKKNGLVAKLYKRLGYNLIENKNGLTIWKYDINEKQPVEQNFIEKIYI